MTYHIYHISYDQYFLVTTHFLLSNTLTQQRDDVTKPQPFKLTKPNRVRYRELSDSQFRDELKDRELSFCETQQRMRTEHLESHGPSASPQRQQGFNVVPLDE